METIELDSAIGGCKCTLRFTRPKGAVVDRHMVSFILEKAVKQYLLENNLSPDQIEIKQKLKVDHPFYSVVDLGVTVI